MRVQGRAKAAFKVGRRGASRRAFPRGARERDGVGRAEKRLWGREGMLFRKM